MKQTNLRRDGRVVKHQAATGRDLTAELAQESHVDSPHSDSRGTGGSIPHGIAMLIDILAREALEMVIAEQMELQARDDLREKTAKSGKPNETAIAGPGVIKIKSCPQQDPRQTDLFQQNQIDIKTKSGLLVAGVGFEPTTFGL